MKKDIILCGVGGDGIVSVAKIISDAALNLGMNVKQSEIHGMSQRGGSVFSHLRISSEPIASDLIAKGGADVIISMEPSRIFTNGMLTVTLFGIRMAAMMRTMPTAVVASII